MTKKLLIHGSGTYMQVAVVEGDQLVDFWLESQEELIGTIYKGKIATVLSGMEAAFIDIGLEQHAFLHVEDMYAGQGIHPLQVDQAPSVDALVRTGEELLVQINKEAIGQKGPKVTTNIALAGRFLIYLPFGQKVRLSRRIEDHTERERLIDQGQNQLTDQEGIIFRTASSGIDDCNWKEELDKLRKKWNDIRQTAHSTPAPNRVYGEKDMVSRIVRDLMTDEVQACMIDDATLYRRFVEEMQDPLLTERVHLHSSADHIFDRNGISSQIKKVFRQKVWLKSGGTVHFDQTEALMAIDVNTGKYTGGDNRRETILQTNLEAAELIANQLRLRDIGGIVIIDFISMDNDKDRQAVLERLKQTIEQDRTQTDVAGFTKLGLVELTRKKRRGNLVLR